MATKAEIQSSFSFVPLPRVFEGNLLVTSSDRLVLLVSLSIDRPHRKHASGDVMNVVAEIGRINEAELAKGIVGGLSAASWHSKYAHSAWIYMGNLPKTLTEGDVICIASQYGEVEDLHLVRHDETGESRGFAFLKYEDARSCILAVDNFTGSKVIEKSKRDCFCIGLTILHRRILSLSFVGFGSYIACGSCGELSIAKGNHAKGRK
mmetsp:Transcript_22969/g.53254  ORF Transcript_22969/g.53254 Transcript_22969/m.53254 type:complete len:207 (-) Transcript_22969:1675-2295(-)